MGVWLRNIICWNVCFVLCVLRMYVCEESDALVSREIL